MRNHLADDFNTAQATTKVRNLITFTERIMKEKVNCDGVNHTTEIDAIAAVSNFVTGYLHSLGFGQVVRYLFLSLTQTNAFSFTEYTNLR